MAKKQLGLLAQGRPLKKSVRHIKDSKIDFSDIPELSDQEFARAKPVGRPKSTHPKQLVAIRLDPRLLAKLRKLAKKRNKPYQTLMHEILEKACEG